MSVKRHTVYDAMGSVVPLAAMVLALPTCITIIGEARYGVLAVLWTLLGYLGLFDMGLGRAVTNRVAALHAETPDRREGVFWTAPLLNLGFGARVLATLAVQVAAVGLMPTVAAGLVLVAITSLAGWKQVRPFLPQRFRAV